MKLLGIDCTKSFKFFCIVCGFFVIFGMCCLSGVVVRLLQ